MLDFLMVATRSSKKGVIEIYPKFIMRKSSDLMIRGGDFYAIWNEEMKLWSTDEEVAINLIDKELSDYAEKYAGTFEGAVRILYLWDSDTGMVDKWHKYCQKQMWDNYHPLDSKPIFLDTPTSKSDYASKRLPYKLAKGSIEHYLELTTKLYSDEERHKFEWTIGAVVDGASSKVQKFVVFYGSAGTGKSTILTIIEWLFEGQCAVFNAKKLGDSNNSFALEPLKANPLVAIEHDGDLSKIKDNTLLNSVVSHETMTVNEKFKSAYSNRFNCLLFIGSNNAVNITDAKSGLIRRLIDVVPTGDKVTSDRYDILMQNIKLFELGAIAAHCREVYRKNPRAYENYIPTRMLGATNAVYNFVLEHFVDFKKEDGVKLSKAWKLYKEFCSDAGITSSGDKLMFQEELKNYFSEFKERSVVEGEVRVRNYYSGFLTSKFLARETPVPIATEVEAKPVHRFKLEQHDRSILDDMFCWCPAQLTTSGETPRMPWGKVETALSDICPTDLHYVKVPSNLVVIDFDLKDSEGKKNLELNLAAADDWPITYAEVSKGGQGLHLHYLYDGDVSSLAPLYSEGIEVKVFTGGSALRRRLSLCNTEPINELTIDLPRKKGVKVKTVGKEMKSEASLERFIVKNLEKGYTGATATSVSLIKKALDEAYEGRKFPYDLTRYKRALFDFARNSTNQDKNCKAMVLKMKLKSADDVGVPNAKTDEFRIAFFDIEVFPNLLLLVYKEIGDHKPVILFNPNPEVVKKFIEDYDIIGFNNRRYDNHILYARAEYGYSEKDLYFLSQKIINGVKTAFITPAYWIALADIYDYSSKKQSLKKFEAELYIKEKREAAQKGIVIEDGIKHKELHLKWDEDAPEELWDEVAAYCVNDVIATEKVFLDRQEDFVTRKVLAALSGLPISATTRQHATAFIFNGEKNPQDEFLYRDLAEPIDDFLWEKTYRPWFEKHNFKLDMENVCFPGYKYENGISTYRGEEVGEGGCVRSKPGIWFNVALLDVESMHPSTIEDEILFGPKYTDRFKAIKDARIHIKHKEFDLVKGSLEGALDPYLDDESKAASLAQALKLVINSVYGYTAASFDNPFRDIRNVDNIVAKRGALFMIDLKNAVEAEGFEVVHIKTDSIKIPNATPEIIEFVKRFGRRYGYNFEHEATYEKMCLVNDAVYIAKYSMDESVNKKHAGEWTATGTQFAVPYVFKTLFTGEEIRPYDLIETKSVTSTLFLDMNEDQERLHREHPDIPLDEEIHNYVFVGKVGMFTPVIPGAGGGVLLREKDGKYYAATGSKGYRWMESEMVSALGLEDKIDMDYYEILRIEAYNAIQQYGDADKFIHESVPPVSSIPADFINVPEGADENGIPFN